MTVRFALQTSARFIPLPGLSLSAANRLVLRCHAHGVSARLLPI